MRFLRLLNTTIFAQKVHCRFQRYVFFLRALLLLACSGFLYAEENPWKSAIANDNISALNKLLSEQVDVEVKDGANRTALMIAAKYADVELFEKLIVRGADIHGTTKRGGNVLMFAVLGRNGKIVAHLVKGQVDVDSVADNGWSAITVAAAKGYVDMLAILMPHSKQLNQQDIYGWTPAMRAVDNGHLNAAELLLASKGADPNVKNEVGETALHRAAENANKAMLELLLAYKVDKNIKDTRGRTARDILRDSGQLELVKLL